MLPLYKRSVRFLSRPYRRMKKGALLGSVAALVLLYVILVGLSSHEGAELVPSEQGGRIAPSWTPKAEVQPAHDVMGAGGNAPELEELAEPVRPGLRRERGVGDDAAPHLEEPQRPPRPGLAAYAARRQGDTGAIGDVDMDGDGDANVATAAVDTAGEVVAEAGAAPSVNTTPFVIRLFLPLLAGFCFGFLGSVPVAGPTSAMVLKLGIQGKYHAGLTIAVGGAISEATYAGIAFWGFGSFLAGAKFLLPVSKVLGAVMFTIVGLIFLRSDIKPPMEVAGDESHQKRLRGRPREEIIKNVLMGLTMSGINPALLATYTGAIASVYGTGMLEFTLFLAVVFGLGVCCGVSTWFFLLLSLLKKYKQRLKNQTIARVMRGMGCFLLTLGAFCAKSSFEYFFLGPAETKS